MASSPLLFGIAFVMLNKTKSEFNARHIQYVSESTTVFEKFRQKVGSRHYYKAPGSQRECYRREGGGAAGGGVW